MKRCDHNVLFGVGCSKCKDENIGSSLELLFKDLRDLKVRIIEIERLLNSTADLEGQVQSAINMLLAKAHDLKKIDAKRDDVINLVCQKIASLERRFNDADTRG